MNPVETEITLISQAGKMFHRRIPYRKNANGFTILELMIVIVIAGLMLSITVPVVRETLLHDNLKTASRKLVATISWLRSKSVSEYRDHILMFKIDEPQKYWHEASNMDEAQLLDVREQATTFPDDVRIVDIDFFGTEKIINGEIGIKFSKKGYIGYTLIHLADKSDRKFTLIIEPFLGKVKIMEDYLNFEDISEKNI